MSKKTSKTQDNQNNNLMLITLLNMFLEYLRARNYSPETIKMRACDIKRFIKWSEERAVVYANQIDFAFLERYLSYLSVYITKFGSILDVQSQKRMYCAVRVFFKWMTKLHYIEVNPAAELEGPRMGRKLPSRIFTLREVELVINQANIKTLIGLRDRAIMETFYSTGVRRAEVVNIMIVHLNTEKGMLMVKAGKGDKDRVIPIGERALAWIERYVEEVRGLLIGNQQDPGYLFVNKFGEKLSKGSLARIVDNAKLSAGVEMKGNCHIFRHTMATLMLEAGADIRYIQQMLGHEQLSTTQIYTHVSDRKLKEVHTRTHPGARLWSKNIEHSFLDDEDDEVELE